MNVPSEPHKEDAEGVLKEIPSLKFIDLKIKMWGLLLEVSERLSPFYRFIQILITNTLKKKIPETAQSLTFVTLLSLVPIFALFFSVLGALTNRPQIRVSLQNYISQYFIPQYGEVVFQYLEQFSKTTIQTGTFGASTFIIVGIFFYARIDRVVNDIWEVEDHRTWQEKVISFLILVVVGPLATILFFTVTTYLTRLPTSQLISSPVMGFLTSYVIPVIFAAVLFFLFYIFFPVVFVLKRAALIGAFISSMILQICYIGLNLYFLEMIGYTKLYGSLAIFPILILWIFIVWFVLLLGAEITYVWQTFRSNNFFEHRVFDSHESVGLSATRAFLVICQRFYGRNETASMEELQKVLCLSDHRLRYLLTRMINHGYIVEYSPQDESKYTTAYKPALPPSNVTCEVFFELFKSKFPRTYFGSEPAFLIMEPLHSLEYDFYSTFTFEDAIKNPDPILNRLLATIGRLRKEIVVEAHSLLPIDSEANKS
ncbi:YhjD/YihY/BrkB family envelope integrity protein [Deltaproteobacteria bacterium TL4]